MFDYIPSPSFTHTTGMTHFLDPRIQLVIFIDLSMHVKNSTRKMSNCTVQPLEISLRSPRHICFRTYYTKHFLLYITEFPRLQSVTSHCSVFHMPVRSEVHLSQTFTTFQASPITLPLYSSTSIFLIP